MVRAKQLQLVLFDAEPISKYVDEYFVVDSVKRRAKVQQHKSLHETFVRCSYDIVVDADDGVLSRVVLSVG